MASPIADSWVYATVRLENEWNEYGTGFLVARLMSPQGGRIFLVTNKHVVNQDPAKRAQANYLRCHFNTKHPDGSGGTATGEVPLRLEDGTSRLREHPECDTDVLAVDITDVVLLNPELKIRWVAYEDFGDQARLTDLEVTVGEEVMVIGYPLGLRQGDSNLPLVRQGILATTIGRVVQDRVLDDQGNIRERSLRAFLFDGATIPGSSGSPVILKPVLGRLMKGSIHLSVAPPILLGIVAETKYAPLEVAGLKMLGFAGLGLAFDANTVKETIELFFPSG